MITALRRKLKSKTARSIFLWIILIALGGGLIVGPRLLRQRGGPSQWIAKVNGYKVPYFDFALKVQENEQILRYFRSQYGEYADMILKSMGMSKNPRDLAFDQVIQQALLNQEADKLSIHLDADFVASKMGDPQFVMKEFGALVPQHAIDPRMGINEQVLKQHLARLGLTIEDFEGMIEKSIQRNLVADLASGAAYVAAFEIKQRYMADYLARKFDVLRFDFNSFLNQAKKEDVTKEQLKAFYDQENRVAKRYWVPEKRSGIAYLFNADSYGVAVDENEIKNYYDDNKMKLFVETPTQIQVRRILFKVSGDKSEVYEKANKLREQLVADPSTFEAVAKKVSEDAETAEKGGLLPFFSKGQKDISFEKPAFLLTEDGAISKVITTKDGIEILQRVGRKNAVFKPIEKVTGEITNKLKQKKFKSLFAKDMDELLRRGDFDKNKFENFITLRQAPDFAKASNFAKASSDRSSGRQDKRKKEEKIDLQIKGPDKRSEALFRIRNGVPAFYFEGKDGVVVKLTETQKRHLPSLQTVEDTVKNDFYEKRASKKLDQVLKKVKQEARAKSLDEVVEAYKKDYAVEFDQTGWVKKTDAEKVNPLRSKGYPVDQMLKLEKAGFVDSYRGGSQETANGFLVKVSEIEPFNEKEYEDKKADIKKSIAQQKDSGAKEEFIAFLREKATIKGNKEVIR